MEPRDFSWALIQLKNGKSVGREGWNRPAMKICLVPGKSERYFSNPNLEITNDYLCLVVPNGAVYPWVAENFDILSDDWIIVE